MFSRRGHEIAESRDDILMLGQHGGEFGLQPVRQGEHIGHVRHNSSCRQGGKQAERRQCELLLANKMRVQAFGDLFRSLTDTPARPRRVHQISMQFRVLCFEGFGDQEFHCLLLGAGSAQHLLANTAGAAALAARHY